MASIYNKVEDKYFDLLDFLDKKGLPVYKYSDFFENHGIPSLVVTVSIIIAIVIFAFVVLTYRGGEISELTLSLKDVEGNSLRGVELKIIDESEDVLFEGNTSDGEKIKLNRALLEGEKILVVTQKEGYQSASSAFIVSKENTNPRIRFDKEFKGIEAKVRIIDKETKTIVLGATVIANTSDLSYRFEDDRNGLYKKTGVPAGVNLVLKVKAEGYNDFEQTLAFNEGQVREIQLTPSDSAFVGKATVAVEVKGVDEKLIDNVKITVYDKRTSTIILSDYTKNGTVIASIQSGIPLRIVAEKEGFLTYDSDKQTGGVTVRKKEERFEILLNQGGQKLTMIVTDSQSGFSLDAATVQLFSLEGAPIATVQSKITGAEFNGLDSNSIVIATAFKEGYLPTKQRIVVSVTDEIKIPLERVNHTNSGRLDIYAIDALGNSINAVKVMVYDVNGGEMFPYGLPLLQTSIAGYTSATVHKGKTYELHGFTDVLEGKETIEFNDDKVSEGVYIKMTKRPNVIKMSFISPSGGNIDGTAKILGLDGQILFDGKISGGEILFDSKQKEVVEARVTMNDGNVFTENVKVKGKDSVEVVVYKGSGSDLSPKIEFISLENEDGDKVNGLTPGAFYWAKFSVVFPRGATKGGVHFRTGQDSIVFAESEKYGIYDVLFQGANVSYSGSYTPNPAPGNESIDRGNRGAQGEKNKWAEGEVEFPTGTVIVKAKIRVDDFTVGKIQLRYRAWAIFGSDVHRSPMDEELGTKELVAQKSGLYAETNVKEFVIFESLPECKNTICLSVNYVDEKERFIDEANFEAMKDKIYSLEVEINSQEQDYVQIVASTDSNLEFVSTQTDNFTFVGEKSASHAKKTASAALLIAKDGKQRARFYFVANSLGVALIKLTATGKSSVEKSLQFKVVEEKEMIVELSETRLTPGRNFTIRVFDNELTPLTTALIKIIDQRGSVKKSILGNEVEGNGRNGYYRVENNLSPGLYTVEVTSPGFGTKSVAFIVSAQTILNFAESVSVRIPQGQKNTVVVEQLTNNSDFTIRDVSIQIESEVEEDNKTIGAMVYSSSKFKVIAVVPDSLSPNQARQVQFNVSYIGAMEDSVDETATITITGLLEGKFHTSVTSKMNLTYNRRLDSSCLKFQTNNVIMNLLGVSGSVDSETIEVTSYCEEIVHLKNRIRAKTKVYGLQLTSDNIDLRPGETKELTITAVNQIERGATREEYYNFDLIFDSNALKKTINVSVRLINPAFALNYPPQVVLWLAQGNIRDKAVAAQPIFVSNSSSFPIENISFSVERQYFLNPNIRISVEPPGASILAPGQAIIPPKVIFASADSKTTDPFEALIVISGKMSNLGNRRGQMDAYGYYSDPYAWSGNYLGGQAVYENFYDYKSNYGVNTPNYSNSYDSSMIDSYNSKTGRYGGYYPAMPLNNYTPSSSNYYRNSSQILGVIKLIVFYSGYDCLKAGLTSEAIRDTYFFPIDGGRITKLLTVTNTCSEPVTILSAIPASEARNQPIFSLPPIMSSIMLAVPNVLIMPGEQAKIPLSVETALSNVKRKNYQIVLTAVSNNSQTQLVTKPISINIDSGVAISEEHAKILKVNAKICGQEKEEEITVPKISEGANCSEGYCDAVNAARYIGLKVRQVLQKAQAQGYSKKNNASEFGCEATGACAFEEIGMPIEEFGLYLQNDKIGAELLEKEINGKEYEGVNTTPFRETLSSLGFIVVPEIVDISFLKPRVLSGYDRTIFLDRDIEGCGYYRIGITGAFRVGLEGLESMTPVLMIKTIPINGKPRLETNECKISMNNVQNFNPIDEGLNSGRDFGTWLTTVESDAQLKEIAEEIAKARYKTEKRATSGGGNKVRVVSAALQNVLAQVCISGAGNDKKTINVTIDNSINLSMDKETKNALKQSVIKMASDALNGSFGNNCLVRSGDSYLCVNLTDLANSAKRKIALITKTINFTSKDGGCIAGTVYSNVPESLDFEITPINPSASNKNFVGIKKIVINADDSVPSPIVSINGAQALAALQPKQTSIAEVYSETFQAGNLPSQKITAPIVLKTNPSSGEYRYYRNVKICAYPTEVNEAQIQSDTAYLQSNGVQFEVAVINRSQNETKEDAKETITISTGSLHPEDLLKILFGIDTKNKLQPGKEYYFTIMWAGNPQTINFEAYKNALVRQGKLDKISVAGEEKTEVQVTNEIQAKQGAVNKFATSCFATGLVCNSLYGGVVAAAPQTALDCAVPLMTTLKEDMLITGWGGAVGRGAQSFIDGVFGVMRAVAIPFGVKVESIKAPDWFRTEKIQPRNWTQQEIDKVSLINMLEGSLVGATARTQTPLFSTRLAGGINKSNINALSLEIADLYREQAEKAIKNSLTTQFYNARKSEIDLVLEEYKKSISDQISNSLNNTYNSAWTRNSKLLPPTGITSSKIYKSVDTTIDVAVENAVSSSNTSFADYLTRAPTSGNFQTNLQLILDSPAGESIEALQARNVLKPGSELSSVLEAKLKIDSSTIGTKVLEKMKQYGMIHEDGPNKGRIMTTISNDDLKSIITDVVDEMPGVTDKKGIIADLFSKGPPVGLMGKTYPDNAITLNLIKDVEATVVPRVVADLKMNGKISAIAVELNEELQKIVNEGTDGKLADLDKKVSKLGAFKTMRGLGMIGYGALCGAVANAAGMQAYAASVESNEKKQSIVKYALPVDYYFTKGKTYKVTITEYEKRPKFEEVTDPATLSVPVGGKLPEAIISSPDEANKLPEERGLNAFTLNTSRTVFRDQIAINVNGYLDAYVPQSNVKLIPTSAPYQRYMNPKFQELVNKYTGLKGIDCKTNKVVLEIQATVGNASMSGTEPLALAIGTTKAAMKEYTSEKIEEELNGKDIWLKDKLIIAIKERANAGGNFTKQVAQKVFPNADQKEIERFIDDVAFWEKVYTSSSKASVDYCP